MPGSRDSHSTAGEEQTVDVFVNRDDPIPSIVFDRGTAASPPGSPQHATNGQDAEQPGHESPSRMKGIRERISAFTDRANLQDRLVEKLLAQIIPKDDEEGLNQPEPGQDKKKGTTANLSPDGMPQRPNFNITTMSNNFVRFNARIGVVFVFQARMIRLMSWRHPTHTLSFLAIYTFVCLEPYLLPILPLVILLIAVIIPNFVARHPAAEFSLSSEQAIGYAPYGPPLAPAVTVKPVKELSRDFFRNMRELQNSMEDFSQAHDAIIALLVPRTNFSNEAQSTSLFVVLFAVCLFMVIAANILPWRLIFLAIGWGATVMGHPAVQKQLQTDYKAHVAPQEDKAKGWVREWVESDVILDSAPETREVEIFELQRLSSAGEWEAWLFSASPYDPLSAGRIAGDRPVGTRFFDDVMPPQGWEWSEKKWALDLWSREWVEERIITGVEVETEGERWVYDIYDEHEADRIGVVDDQSPPASLRGRERGHSYPPKPSWEEGDDAEGRRGEWRRRRWVRMVKRKQLSPGQEVIS